MTTVLSCVVELAGLPGSGKTTLATALRERLLADGIPCTVADHGVSAHAAKHARMARRTGYALRELTAAPAATTRATRVLVGSGQEAPRDAAAVLAQWLATEHLAARGRGRPGVQLLEEGLVQATWTAMLRARDLRPEALWECLPPEAHTDLVLFVDVHPELAASRLAARLSKHSRTQRLNPAARIHELRRGQAVLDEVLTSCPLRVVHLTTAGEEVEDVAEQAYQAVLSLR